MRSIRIVCLAVLLPVAAIVALLAAHSYFATSYSGSRTGNAHRLLMEYAVFNTSDAQELELAAGDTLAVELANTAGSVDVTIQKGEDEPLYTGSGLTNAAFHLEIAEGGPYVVRITGRHARGSARFERL